MPINLHFCNCLRSLHQLAPIVEDVSKMVLDGVRLPNMRSMSFEAYLTEEGLLPQAVELRCFILVKLHLIKVEAEVVMRSGLACFWDVVNFLSLRAHLYDRFLLLIHFDLDFLTSSRCLCFIRGQTRTLGVSLFYLDLMNVHWRSINICVRVLTKAIFLGFHLFEEYRSLKIIISFNFRFGFHLFFYLIGDLLIPFHHLYHLMSLFKRFLGFCWFLW
jgi:hypothetical protein